MDNITPCLWFDRQAEEAARFYVGLFPDSRIIDILCAPADYDNGREGEALMVSFSLRGRTFSALNAGPQFKFNQAISLQVPCEGQAELDHYWNALSAHPESEQCGWCKDKYGLSWQIFPRLLMESLSDPDPARRKRVFLAMGNMKKIDVAAILRAAQ
jgi:predicted 3-demethylubiquinone-9 3-methyltransferase (glyoxalase superfamily)